MEVKSFGVHISNVAPGDSRPILQGRYHAPIIPGSAYEIPYEYVKTMDEHVDGGSNQ
jgi:hypothetical protein